MKDYEGPAFKQHAKVNERKFKQSIRQGSGKFTFEPAFKQKKSNQKFYLQRNRQDDIEKDKLTQTASEKALSLEQYEIPYLKKQHQTKSTIQPKEYEFNQAKGIEEESNDLNRTQRELYKPSIAQQIEEKPKEFKATQLPEPYNDLATNKKLDRNLRTLAQRLNKTKDSFILFEK